MSLDIHFKKYQHYSATALNIKTEAQSLIERESLADYTIEDSHNQVISEIYGIVRNIKDPEHPYTLEQLDVVNITDIKVKEIKMKKIITIYWKPSVPTSGFAIHIGLAILLKLERCLNGVPNVKIDIQIKKGAHKNKKTIDKQLNDKERVTAAKENEDLMNAVEALIS